MRTVQPLTRLCHTHLEHSSLLNPEFAKLTSAKMMITWPKTLMSITVARENQRDKPNSRTRIAYSRRKARTEFLESDRLKRLDLPNAHLLESAER